MAGITFSAPGLVVTLAQADVVRLDSAVPVTNWTTTIDGEEGDMVLESEANVLFNALVRISDRADDGDASLLELEQIADAAIAAYRVGVTDTVVEGDVVGDDPFSDDFPLSEDE